MSRARLLVAEAWASIRQNISTTVASTLTVLIGMVLLGLFIAFFTLVLSWSAYVQNQLQVHVYFQTSATQSEITAVGKRLRSDPRVKTGGVVYCSKTCALDKMKAEFPDLFKTNLPSNPLPASYTVAPVHAGDVPKIGKELRNAHIASVEKISWGSATASKVLKIARWLWITFLVGAILLVVASTLLIANTIRLSIFARRREIEVMKLVGASNWFIRGPFVLEGFLVGIAGSILAILVLALGKEIILPAINLGTGSAHAWPFSLNALLLLTTGVILGATGSGLTLRRFLQV